MYSLRQLTLFHLGKSERKRASDNNQYTTIIITFRTESSAQPGAVFDLFDAL